MSMRLAQRLALIAFALFPAIWGWLGLINDATDFNDTAQNAVKPMIEMTNTYGNPWQTLRAIKFAWAPDVALVAIMAAETLAGLLATIGLLVMLRHLFGATADFARGKAWMILGAIVAVLVWGVGFMVIAGDWFLAWEASTNPLNTQLGAMVYFLPCALALLAAMFHREDVM